MTRIQLLFWVYSGIWEEVKSGLGWIFTSLGRNWQQQDHLLISSPTCGLKRPGLQTARQPWGGGVRSQAHFTCDWMWISRKPAFLSIFLPLIFWRSLIINSSWWQRMSYSSCCHSRQQMRQSVAHLGPWRKAFRVLNGWETFGSSRVQHLAVLCAHIWCHHLYACCKLAFYALAYGMGSFWHRC